MRGTDLNTFLDKHVDAFLANIWEKYRNKNTLTTKDKENVICLFSASVSVMFKAASNNEELIDKIYKHLALNFHPDKLDADKSEQMILFIKILGESKVAFQIIGSIYDGLRKKEKHFSQSAASSGGATFQNAHLNGSNIERFFFYNFNCVMSDISNIAGNDREVEGNLIRIYLYLQIILCPEIFLIQLLGLAAGSVVFAAETLLLPSQNNYVTKQLLCASGLPTVIFANTLNIAIKGVYNAAINAPQLVYSSTQLLGENVSYITNRVADAVSVLNIYGYFSGSEANQPSKNNPILLIEDNKNKQEQDQVSLLLNKAEELLSAVIYEERTYAEMFQSSFSFFSAQSSENVVWDKKAFLLSALNTVKEYQKTFDKIKKIKVVKQITNLLKHEVEPKLLKDDKKRSTAVNKLLNFIGDMVRESEAGHVFENAAASTSPSKT